MESAMNVPNWNPILPLRGLLEQRTTACSRTPKQGWCRHRKVYPGAAEAPDVRRPYDLSAQSTVAIAVRGIFFVDTQGGKAMRAKVQKWGNSLAIRIPRGFAEQLGVQQDSEVDLALDKDGLVIKPTGGQQSLAALLSQVTDDNIHREVETGEPTGREVW